VCHVPSDHGSFCFWVADVIVTPHTAFLTEEALEAIAKTTVQNLTEFANGSDLTNEVKATK
jgi:D-lactate dehydrogenase